MNYNKDKIVEQITPTLRHFDLINTLGKYLKHKAGLTLYRMMASNIVSFTCCKGFSGFVCLLKLSPHSSWSQFSRVMSSPRW